MRDVVEILSTYCEAVLNGDIKASKAVKRAVERFLSDMEAIDKGESEYYFDLQEVEDFDKFASLFHFKEGVSAGKPILLVDFQLFIAANIFGFKRKSDGQRRFKRAYIQLARKQAKSFLLAIILAYDSFLYGEKRQGFIAGTKSEQSKIVYNQILDILSTSPVLRGKYTDSYGRITVKRNGSVIRPLSKEDGRKGDGLFPAVAVADELHLHQTSEMYDVLLSGQVGQSSPLIVAITTAGLDLSTFGYQEYQYCKNILDPENPIENEEYFIFIAEYDEDDEWTDPTLFEKANPLTVKLEGGVEDLEARLQVAMDVPEKKREFMTKHLNIWVQAKREGYMDMSVWAEAERDLLAGPLGQDDLVGKPVYVGADLSTRFDLTSLSFLVPVGDKLYIHSHSFMPSEAVAQKEYEDLVPYRDWIEQGYITATPGDVVDYSYVRTYMEDFITKNGLDLHLVCLDPWNATSFAIELEKDGMPTVEVPQSFAKLGPSVKEFKTWLHQDRLDIEFNPVLRWAAGNAIIRKDQNENTLITKDMDRQRIDPLAAVLTGFAQAHMADIYDDVNVITDEYLDSLGW